MNASTTTGSRAAGAAASRPRRRRAVAPSMAFDALFDTAAETSGPPATLVPHHRPAGGQTFDEIIAGAWEDLSAHRAVTCPVCRSVAMRPRYGAGQGAVGGRCDDCGSVLG